MFPFWTNPDEKTEQNPKEVANTINTKMRDSGLKAYTAKAMSGKVSDTLEQMQSYSSTSDTDCCF